MARQAFFSFHYDRDIMRVMQVRNSWVITGERSGQKMFHDKAELEQAKRKAGGTEQWIELQMKGASVTVVLIGAETADRKWVKHEIKRSHEERMGMLGIYIHKVKCPNSGTDVKGANPFDKWQITRDGKPVLFSELYPTYDWESHDGRTNMANWIEAAAKKAGR